ncbi:MAG: hypothetical protein NT040_02675 [Bacteroidetes bacterium]|nr:hypothetical protein [Bacteroidota bacterium]
MNVWQCHLPGEKRKMHISNSIRMIRSTLMRRTIHFRVDKIPEKPG